MANAAFSPAIPTKNKGLRTHSQIPNVQVKVGRAEQIDRGQSVVPGHVQVVAELSQFGLEIVLASATLPGLPFSDAVQRQLMAAAKHIWI